MRDLLNFDEINQLETIVVLFFLFYRESDSHVSLWTRSLTKNDVIIDREPMRIGEISFLYVLAVFASRIVCYGENCAKFSNRETFASSNAIRLSRIFESNAILWPTNKLDRQRVGSISLAKWKTLLVCNLNSFFSLRSPQLSRDSFTQLPKYVDGHFVVGDEFLLVIFNAVGLNGQPPSKIDQSATPRDGRNSRTIIILSSRWNLIHFLFLSFFFCAFVKRNRHGNGQDRRGKHLPFLFLGSFSLFFFWFLTSKIVVWAETLNNVNVLVNGKRPEAIHQDAFHVATTKKKKEPPEPGNLRATQKSRLNPIKKQTPDEIR